MQNVPALHACCPLGHKMVLNTVSRDGSGLGSYGFSELVRRGFVMLGVLCGLRKRMRPPVKTRLFTSVSFSITRASPPTWPMRPTTSACPFFQEMICPLWGFIRACSCLIFAASVQRGMYIPANASRVAQFVRTLKEVRRVLYQYGGVFGQGGRSVCLIMLRPFSCNLLNSSLLCTIAPNEYTFLFPPGLFLHSGWLV